LQELFLLVENKIMDEDNQQFQKVKDLKFHTHRISEIIALPNNQFCSIGEDKRTVLYDFENEFIAKRFLREDYIRHCLLINSKNILFHDLVGNFIITNLQDFSEISIRIRGLYTSSVVFKNNIILCGMSSISVMNIETLEIESVLSLEDRMEFIWNIKLFHGDKAIFGTSTGFIYVLNLKDYSIVKKIQAHQDGEISALFYSTSNLIVSGCRFVIKFWNDSNFECVYEIKHQWKLNCVTELKDQRLAFGCSDGCIRIWDLKNQNCFKTITAHDSNIESLITLTNGFLVSGGDDECIKIWKTPQFDKLLMRNLKSSIENWNFYDLEFKFKSLKRKRF
jgi:WD40 repeat protein